MKVSCQLHSRGKSSRYPLDRRLGGPQSRFLNTYGLPDLDAIATAPVSRRLANCIMELRYENLMKDIFPKTFTYEV